jgi:peptide/nickel transport system substrate-binding protein
MAQLPNSTRTRATRAVMALVGIMLLAGCATPRPPGGDSPSPSAPRQPKTLRIGWTKEPATGIIVFNGGGTGQLDSGVTFHSSLTVYDGQGTLTPRIAQKIPTIEDGDWTLSPDGQMQLTWRLRPGVRWQDGTPISLDDFRLSQQVLQDREIPLPKGPWGTNVDSIQTVDDTTMTVVWKRPYFQANVAGSDDFPILPDHILGRLYESGDKQAFINNPYWTRDFVGLGPYRITSWVVGSQMEAIANDDYVLGRPKIARLTYRFFTDTQALVASLLAGDIDFVPIGSLKVDQIVSLREQWEAAGAGKIINSSNGLRALYLQYRDPSQPWVGDLRVREALVEALDRQTLVDTLQHGLTTVGHTLPTPDDPLYQLVEQRGLPRYAYDPRHAQDLLGQAGWTKAADGKYQNSGKPFTFEIRTVVTAPETQQEIVAISEAYKADGFDSPIFGIRQGATDSSELRAKATGAFDNYIDDSPEALNRFISSQIATEANSWRGQNVWGYSDAAFDQTYERYTQTLSLGPRQSIMADMLKRAADELIWLPLWYYLGTTNIAVRTGLQGPGGMKSIFQADAWNIHTWDLN